MIDMSINLPILISKVSHSLESQATLEVVLTYKRRISDRWDASEAVSETFVRD